MINTRPRLFRAQRAQKSKSGWRGGEGGERRGSELLQMPSCVMGVWKAPRPAMNAVSTQHPVHRHTVTQSHRHTDTQTRDAHRAKDACARAAVAVAVAVDEGEGGTRTHTSRLRTTNPSLPYRAAKRVAQMQVQAQVGSQGATFDHAGGVRRGLWHAGGIGALLQDADDGHTFCELRTRTR